MLALTPPKTTTPFRPPSSLKPPKTGGKLYLPGFHRTPSSEYVASIAYETLRPSRVGSLYGRGFYMTRTLTAQRRRTMYSYGRWIVRCSVDVSRFICFDRVAAYRVWGIKNASLKAQMAKFGPWTKEQEEKIKVMSEYLTRFWDHGPFTIEKRDRHYLGTRDDTVSHSAVLARIVYLTFELDKRENVPGIIYTGKRDGPCVLAYDLKRVQPLKCQNDKRDDKKTKLTWGDFEDSRFRYKLNPLAAYDDCLQTYRTAFIRKVPLLLSDVMEGWGILKSKTPIERWAYVTAFFNFSKNRPRFVPVRKALLKAISDDPRLMDYFELRAFPVLNLSLRGFFLKNDSHYVPRYEREESTPKQALINRIAHSNPAIHKYLVLAYTKPMLREVFLFLREVQKKFRSYKTQTRRRRLMTLTFGMTLEPGFYYQTYSDSIPHRMTKGLKASGSPLYGPNVKNKMVLPDVIEVTRDILQRLLFAFCKAMQKEPLVKADSILSDGLAKWAKDNSSYDVPIMKAYHECFG